MNAFKSSTAILFLAGITILSCKSDVIDGSIMVDDTRYETVNLEDMTSELELIRIKTDESLLIGRMRDYESI